MHSERSRKGRPFVGEQEQELVLWNKVCHQLEHLQSIHSETDNISRSISKYVTRASNSDKPSFEVSKKLIRYTIKGREQIKEEKSSVNKILENLKILIAIREAVPEKFASPDGKLKKRKAEDTLQTPDVKKSKSASKSSSSSKANPASIKIEPGSYVAARPSDNKTKDHEWILAVVVHYYSKQNRYEVEDAEDVADNPHISSANKMTKGRKFSVSAKSIIELPKGSKLLKIFPVGHQVLALYPNTSCFYRATVVCPPIKEEKVPNDGKLYYTLCFEDDNNVEQKVISTMVVDMPPH